jgi:hypothetical protein
MKTILVTISAIVCISATMLLSIYESLDVTKDEAKKDLLSCMGEGWFVTHDNSHLVGKARSLPVEEQVEGVRQLILLAKEYTETDEFKKDYKNWRNKKLNPNTKTKIGLPKFGKILENKIDNSVDKEKNEKKYPSDPTEMIKKRLTDFLAVSATVDFDAKLTAARTFEDPAYEKKSSDWKMCYRAGHEVVEAAREEAQKWLDELNNK